MANDRTSLPEVLPPRRSLAELARIIDREHAAVATALAGALHHALVVGEALHEAHEQVPAIADWELWLRGNVSVTRASASRYERLYHYRDRLPPTLFEPTVSRNGLSQKPPSLTRAMAYLRELPPIRPAERHTGFYLPAVREEAQRLYAQGGMKKREIAELLGVHEASVSVWTRPGGLEAARKRTARYNQQKRRAAAALRREQRAKEVRRAGKNLAKIYSATRQSLQQADAELSRADAPKMRREWQTLISELHRIEDRVGRILRLGDGPDG